MLKRFAAIVCYPTLSIAGAVSPGGAVLNAGFVSFSEVLALLAASLYRGNGLLPDTGKLGTLSHFDL